ncbi:MAG: ATP-dependent RecD-like DNA helicase [Pelotomaculum sp. PtaU1.Bin035]|nr:MAG: ATP-dependent RecD-like DNA helicase [Pelotomaculum sp. PtaU1.Bin035]
MAMMFPSCVSEGCSSPGEREIFRRLRDDPGTSGWTVLHSLDVANHRRQLAGEIDFVIIIPAKGILCLEVKACSSLRREGGLWYYGSGAKPDPRGPFKQASEAMHSLRQRLVAKNPGFSRVVFWSAVIFPYIRFTATSGEWHEWQVIDSRDFRSASISRLILNVIDKARDFLRGCPSALWFNPKLQEPSLEQCKIIADVLRPGFEFFEDSKTVTLRREAELKQYTEEQYMALDAMETNPRVAFAGPAGTGKTLLAIEAARRGITAGRKVLFICFNRFLGRWLERQTSGLHPGVVTKTLHRHMLDIAEAVPDDTSSGFWQDVLPLLATEKMLDKFDDKNHFDELVVDEAQDILRDSYLDFLDLNLKGGLSAGRWRLFGDFEKQAIYDAASLSLDKFVQSRRLNVPVYSLRVNCRNTPRVASLAYLLGGLEPGYSRVLRPDDRSDPELIYYSDENGQKQLLVNVLERFYREGFSGKEIVILSPLADGACATRVEQSPWRDRLRPIETADKGHTGYCTIHSFKGLEAPCVIITDIDRIADGSLFYTGVTRSLQRLVILCHQSVKKEVASVLLNRTASTS